MANRKETIEKINDMISDVKTALLVTVDSNGNLHSRPMTTQEVEFDGDVWFFASDGSDVVEEIKQHSDVNVAYSEDGKFVSLTGKASIVMDDRKKKDLWHPELKVWFGGKGPESPTVALIKVSATEAEFWETGDGMIGNAVRTVKALLTGDEATPIESGKTTL